MLGRRRANTTFFESHATDDADQVWFAMDLTPLVRDPDLDPIEYALRPIDALRNDVEKRIKRFS
ncbi:MAG: hypothetical protein AAF585_05900 [Verrucomicrobiota bacterium]